MGELMTVLVTGGAGYIGSHMVRALAEAGESVVVIDNLSTGFSAFLPEGVALFIGDAADENLVEGVIAAHGVESIIHFAGSVVVPDSMRDPLAYYRNNTMTTRSLLNAAVKCGVNRFIFSSTAAVYGNPDQVPVPENAPTRPLSPYGSSKLMTEIMLHDVASAHGMNYVVLRYFNVAGADPLARIGLATVGATPSFEDRGRGGHRTARQDRRVRNRLSDAGRKLRAGITRAESDQQDSPRGRDRRRARQPHPPPRRRTQPARRGRAARPARGLPSPAPRR